MATTQDLLDLRNIAARRIEFRFQLLDASLNPIGDLEIDGSSPPSIRCDTGRPVQRTLSGLRIPRDRGGDFDPRATRVRPWMVLENGDSGPLGTFVFVDGRRATNSRGTAFDGELHDLSFLVDQQTRETFSVRPGTNIAGVIRGILTRQAIDDAFVTDTGAVTGSRSIGWPPGSSWLAIVNELALLAGCLPLSFDAFGQARVDPSPDIETADPVVTFEDGRNIIDSDILRWDDSLTAPNLIVVVDSSGAASPIRGEYEVPADAPNSYYRLGFHIPLVLIEQGVASNYGAAQMARTYALTSAAVVEHLAFEGPIDWRHGAYSVLSVQGERWLERAWSMPLTPTGRMTHEATRIYR